MARIIDTSKPLPTDPMGQLAVYSGLDNMTLFEILDGMLPLLTEAKLKTYAFEMRLQAALLEMSFNGIKVDQGLRADLIHQHEKKLVKVQASLHKYAEAIGYYHYYIRQARLRFADATGLPLSSIPSTWHEWLTKPIQWRRTVKQIDPEACLEYQKAIKAFNQPFNGNSPAQKLRLFYDFFGHADNTVSQMLSPDLPPPWNKTRGISEIRTRDAHGAYTPSTDRDSLEKIEAIGLNFDQRDAHYWALPFISCCLEIADITKTLGTLRCRLQDGYFRASFGTVTETGRLASKENAQGYGSNAQNITPPLRVIFCTELGWKLAAPDYEQIESRNVGAIAYRLFGATNYLNACNCGDLHTLVCAMIWPDLPWPSEFTIDGAHKYGRFPPDMIKAAKAIANQVFYRQFTYRDLAKRGGHGCLTHDHEVLTPTGWQPISNKPPIIMQSDGTFVPVSNWIDKVYKGKFVFWDGQAISAVMTADHRVYYTTDDPNNLHVLPAQNIPPSARIPLSLPYTGGTINETYAQLLAAYHCDGSYKSTNRVDFHFHKERKLERIKELATFHGIKFDESPYRITLHWTPSMHAPDWSMLEWTPQSLALYMDELPYWDGHFGKTSTSLHSSNPVWIEMWQTFNRLLGKGGNIQKPRMRGFGTLMHKVQINKRRFAAVSSLTSNTLFEANARVYCPTVPAQSFYIRRQGKISITGNSNYMGLPPHMAKMLHVETSLMEHFQRGYFDAFPEIPQWHQWVATQLQTTGEITTMLGRTRRFFGRPTESATLREAVAFEPQSIAADYTDMALADILDAQLNGLPIKLFLQKHDEIGFRYKEQDEDLTVPSVISIMERHIEILSPSNKPYDWFVPVDASTGWNLGHVSESNPDGLAKWKGHDDRVRQRNPDDIFNRIIRG